MAVSGHNFSVWGEFRRPLAALDRCTHNKGAFAFKIVRGGALKWPLKGGSRLIQVAATAGLTVQLFEVQPCADPESYVRGWRADNGPTLNAGLVAVCDFSGDLEQYCLETLFL